MSARSEEVQSLIDRLERLEYLTDGTSDTQDLLSQVDELGRLTTSLFEQSPDLASASATATDLGILDTAAADDVTAAPPTAANSTEASKASTNVSTKAETAKTKAADQEEYDAKSAVVQAKLKMLNDLAGSLDMLNQTVLSDDITGDSITAAASAQHSKVPEAQKKVDQLTDEAADLNVQSAQTSAKFLEATAEQNSVLEDFEKRMDECERALRSIERAYKETQAYGPVKTAVGP